MSELDFEDFCHRHGLAARAKAPKPAKVAAATMDALRQKLIAAAYTANGVDLHTLFHFHDKNNDSRLYYEDFERAVRRDGKVTPLTTEHELGICC